MEILTDKQRKLVSENHNLIYSILKDRGLPALRTDEIFGEDWYGLAAIGLCKAAAIYDEKKGYAFSTIAYRCMDHEIGHALRAHNAQKSIPAEALISYDAKGYDLKSNDTKFKIRDNKWGSFLEIFPDACNIQDDAIEKLTFNQVMESMNERERYVINGLIFGMKQADIAKKTGMSPAYISKTKRKFLMKYETEG